MVRRRLRREPVAYILGRKGFRQIELAVDRRVLVPRPETELLVEVALERRPARVLDVGTGSGAIALAVADELPECEVVATDTSPGALEVARANAARLGLAERVTFVEGTLPQDGLGGEGESAGVSGGRADAGFDLVLANLPYIPDGDWLKLQPEVRDWEPREALLAGPDGLDAYRVLIPTCACLFSPSGRIRTGALAVEVGMGQAAVVGELMRDAGFEVIEVRRDLAGIERVVVGAIRGLNTPGRAQPAERA
jgi:release factor glutamine methyltransferase